MLAYTVHPHKVTVDVVHVDPKIAIKYCIFLRPSRLVKSSNALAFWFSSLILTFCSHRHVLLRTMAVCVIYEF